MINFLKSLFKSKTFQEKVDEHRSNCIVEYRPLENRYYPKFKNNYLYDCIGVRIYKMNQSDAWLVHDQMIESLYDANVAIFKR